MNLIDFYYNFMFLRRGFVSRIVSETTIQTEPPSHAEEAVEQARASRASEAAGTCDGGESLCTMQRAWS